jgi:hypothetical protein
MSSYPSDRINTPDNQHPMLTERQFIMEARKYASEKAEHGVHRWHVVLLILLFLIAIALTGVGFKLHIDEPFWLAAGTVIVMIASYCHSRWFSGYYAIYCREWQRADQAIAECNQLKKQLAEKAAAFSSGVGPPTGKGEPGQLYFDTSAKAFYVGQDERDRLLKDNTDLKKQLADIRNSPTWTDTDAARETMLMDVRRWVKSGSAILSKVDGEISSTPGPFLSNDLMTECNAWNAGADAYVASTFKDFLAQFRSFQGMPPMQQSDHRDMMRKELYRRVERFRQLKTRFEPDAASIDGGTW